MEKQTEKEASSMAGSKEEKLLAYGCQHFMSCLTADNGIEIKPGKKSTELSSTELECPSPGLSEQQNCLPFQAMKEEETGDLVKENKISSESIVGMAATHSCSGPRDLVDKRPTKTEQFPGM